MTATRPICVRCGTPLPEGHPPGRPCPRCLFDAGLGASAPPEGAGVSGSVEASAPPSPESIAPLFPALEILGVIGQGGMGVVYRARQKELGREVALKLLWARAAAHPALEERFLREARTLARLNHPNIVAVHDFGRTGEHLYLVQELVEGTNMRQALRQGRIEPGSALSVVTQVCAGLQYAHEEGVVHRDIKPENILIDGQGRVKIADFGLAKLLEPEGPRERLTQAGEAMGTPQYMAPEQLERPLAVDHRADIYSLGVVFYELLTGELPLGRFAPPSRKVEIDVRLDGVVLKALEKEPELRYQRASEVRTEVENIVNHPEAAPAAEPKKRSALFWIAVVAIPLFLVFLVCAAMIALYTGARVEGPEQVEAVPIESGK